jgi:alanyl-tRNA synthetase
MELRFLMFENTTKFPSKEAFNLIDSTGFPFEIFIDFLREKNMFIDVFEFVGIASKSKNYEKPDKLRNMLVQTISPKVDRDKVIKLIDKSIAIFYPNGLQNKKKR